METETTQNMFKFKVENLGCIKKGEFTQKPLTIFCGPNNSGKTWTMYSLYHFYCNIISRKRVIEKDKESTVSLEKFNTYLSRSLPDVFNTTSEDIKNANFSFNVTKEDFDYVIRTEINSDSNTFLIPAERSGLHLFFRELRTRRTALLHYASIKNINIDELLKDVIRSRYAIPIAKYINWLNDMDEITKQRADFHDFAQQIQKKLVGGIYKVSGRTSKIEFKPYQKKRDGNNTQYMSLHLTSSIVKSLFGLWFYLQNQAKKGDILMIDEPELNIHPENQRQIARLLAKLVNAGLKVVISTHSDYIVREFNSLIMLSQDKNGTLQKKHKYLPDEILKTEQVAAYLFDNQTIEPFKISNDDGIYATTFDEVIKDINQVNDDIYYSLQDTKYDDG